MHRVPPGKKETSGPDPRPAGENPLFRLRTEINELVDRVLSGLPIPREVGKGALRLWSLDVEDTGHEVVVRAEAPGFEAGDFDVELQGDVLTVKAECKAADEDKTVGLAGKRPARYERTVSLPEGIDRDKVEAVYRNGVLVVRVGKLASVQSQQIHVKP